MANEEHLSILKKGVNTWNQWREEHLNVEIDLSKASLNNINLKGVDLSEANLSNIDLSKANLNRANLNGANLSYAVLSGAKLNKADLGNANLSRADLSGIDLSEAMLGSANLSGADLSGSYLSEANFIKAYLSEADLNRADLSEASLVKAYLTEAYLMEAFLLKSQLRGAQLRRANLSSAELSFADLSKADLSEAEIANTNLTEAKLMEANLCGANLSSANLDRANLRKSKLCEANLNKANCREVNFSEADLNAVQALATDFKGSNLTGACLEDWNTNSSTILEEVICEYVYLKREKGGFEDRRPSSGIYSQGEFSTLFQQALDTVDLIFVDGIDWKVFFSSFQELREQYDDQDLSIQAIEKKRGGAFVVRLEVPEDADKPAIEGKAKQLYGTKLMLMEQCYRAELQAKDGEIVAYKQQSANLMEIAKLLAARPMNSEVNQTNTFNAPVGNIAGTNQGTMQAIQNIYGPSADEISRLISTLREQAEAFPADNKDEALDVLDDLEADIQKPEPDQNRIGRRLKRLVAIATAVGAIAGGAATFSGNLNDFTSNVIGLTETLGIPIEQVQPNPLPPADTP